MALHVKLTIGLAASAISALAGALTVSTYVAAQSPQQAVDETETLSIAVGGQIYDDWFVALEADEPKATHPSYPAAGRQKGAVTWRCKECHGWDYKGAAGAYSKGSHFTGINGIRNRAGGDLADVVRILRDRTHQYTEQMIPESAARKVALFVTRGQTDTDTYVDSATKKARGDAARGAPFFQTICAVCHGQDGKELNFGSDKTPEYVGTLARDNPWEGLHKILNGQPGAAMVSLRALNIQDIVDILAYAQTLPAK